MKHVAAVSIALISCVSACSGETSNDAPSGTGTTLFTTGQGSTAIGSGGTGRTTGTGETEGSGGGADGRRDCGTGWRRQGHHGCGRGWAPLRRGNHASSEVPAMPCCHAPERCPHAALDLCRYARCGHIEQIIVGLAKHAEPSTQHGNDRDAPSKSAGAHYQRACDARRLVCGRSTRRQHRVRCRHYGRRRHGRAEQRGPSRRPAVPSLHAQQDVHCAQYGVEHRKIPGGQSHQRLLYLLQLQIAVRSRRTGHGHRAHRG